MNITQLAKTRDDLNAEISKLTSQRDRLNDEMVGLIRPFLTVLNKFDKEWLDDSLNGNSATYARRGFPITDIDVREGVVTVTFSDNRWGDSQDYYGYYPVSLVEDPTEKDVRDYVKKEMEYHKQELEIEQNRLADIQREKDLKKLAELKKLYPDT